MKRPALIIPQNGGSYLVRPAPALPPQPGAETKARIAAHYLGVSLPTMYRLLALNLIAHRRKRSGMIRINVDSLRKFKEGSSKPGFWDRATKKGGRP